MRIAIFILISLSVAFATEVTSKGCDDHSCHKEVNKCGPGRYWSEQYEGGACICPRPFAPTYTHNQTVGSEVLPVTITSPLACEQGYTWDVVACQCIPDCKVDYTWNAIRGQCICDIDIDCSKKCSSDCSHKHRSPCKERDECHRDCEREIFDPSKCACVKKCDGSKVNCIFGTHFDEKECKCVRNTCPHNYACPNGTRFDSNHCMCVSGACRHVANRTCSFGFHFDETVCKCVVNECPSSLCCPIVDEVKQVADPNQGCACVAPTCLRRECLGGRSWNETTCNCTCPEITCLNGTVNPYTCQCECQDPNKYYNSTLGTCVCKDFFSLNETSGLCQCNATLLTCVEPLVANLTSCSCQCNATLANCTSPYILNATDCTCRCPNVTCCGGTVNSTCQCQCDPDQILVNNTCVDPCPGVPNCPFGSTLDLSVCTCKWNCSLAPACHSPMVHDIYEACECTRPCKPRNCPAGSFQMLEDCKCHAICGNVCPQRFYDHHRETCAKGDSSCENLIKPDYNNSCVCPPINCTSNYRPPSEDYEEHHHHEERTCEPDDTECQQIVYPHLNADFDFEIAGSESEQLEARRLKAKQEDWIRDNKCEGDKCHRRRRDVGDHH